MKLIISEEEFKMIYKFTLNMQSANANRIYNSIFGSNPRKEFTVRKLNDTELELTVDESISVPIMKIIADHSYDIKTLASGNPITIIPRVKSFLVSMKKELMKLL